MKQREKPDVGRAQHRHVQVERAEGADAEARRMRFIASDESVDRYGDIIRVEGWDLSNFKANPVLLFGHDSRSVPIGRVTEIAVEGRALVASAEFRPEGDSEMADDVWRALQGKFLNAVSVGFLPTKMPNDIKDPATNEWTGGYEFIAQELLELSVVPVPANPQALALARALNLSADAQSRLFIADERAVARVAAEHRSHTLAIARLRPGHFGGSP
jgi:HK97 family phage prohead protease